MKKATLLFACLFTLAFAAKTQNADNLYYNSLSPSFDYQAASFVIDTAKPTYGFQRAMLLWATNTGPATTQRSLTLDETIANGTPVTQHINVQNNTVFKGLQPKKIIRSKFSKNYYLLAYVVNSTHLINNIAVTSSAFVLKLDDNLNLVWSSKIHFNPVTAANAGALIEYNDIIETNDKNIVIVGRYARTQTDRQGLQMAKLDQGTGLNIWWYWYFLWSCHANGLSVAEASNGELAVTGYAEQCTPPAFNGNRQLLFARTRSDGTPIQFRKFLNSGNFCGDKITRFITTAIAGADRFFITGFTDVPTPVAGVFNRQNLVIDIAQNGTINRASHFGESPRSEEVNDHIFSKLVFVASTYELYLTGYTNSYTSNSASEAYFSILRYNSATLTFTITRYDVMRNTYPPSTVYNSRRGIEVKNAGPRRFAILLNSSFTNTTTTVPPVTYIHAYTNVFVRDLTAADTVCQRPKTPPLTNTNWHFLDTTAIWQGPNYKVYPEIWTITQPIPFSRVCGTNWVIFPKQAINAMVNPPDEIAPDEDVPTARQAVAAGKLIQGDVLFPNPAGSEVTIALNKSFALAPRPVSIRLLSPEMKVIRTESISYRPYHSIALRGLLPGMYVIEVVQGNSKRLYRFVKE
jgi:hypothetical protein